MENTEIKTVYPPRVLKNDIEKTLYIIKLLFNMSLGRVMDDGYIVMKAEGMFKPPNNKG